MRTLKEWGKECHEGMQSKGFRQKPISPEDGIAAAGELMLVNSELAEVMEELRSPEPMVLYFNSDSCTGRMTLEQLLELCRQTPGLKPERVKPEGLGPELADVCLRLLGLAYAWGIDIEAMMEMKNAYNKTRTMGHGNKRF